MRGSTSVGYDQFETSPEAIEQELRPAVCERRPTDRLKANYSTDIIRYFIMFVFKYLENRQVIAQVINPLCMLERFVVNILSIKVLE